MKKIGFTLAEVLVTLGIIGVVSAMTVPSLMQNYQRQSYVTQLHKVYNEISQAAMTMMNDHNALNLSETPLNESNNTAAKDFLKKYFRIVQDCGKNITPCFANDYKTLNGTNFTNWKPLIDNKSDCVVAAAGYSMCMDKGIGDTSEEFNGNTYFWVDINGQKGPNVLGRDFFYFELYSDGKVAESYEAHTYSDSKIDENFNNLCKTGASYGAGCFSKVVKDGWKMDY